MCPLCAAADTSATCSLGTIDRSPWKDVAVRGSRLRFRCGSIDQPWSMAASCEVTRLLQTLSRLTIGTGHLLESMM